MNDSLKRKLDLGLETLGVAASDAQRNAMLELVERLVHWSTKVNLTSIREPAAIIERHLFDSLTLSSRIHGARVLDIGTGGGFPGLPLAIVRPDVEFVLLDAVAKKIRFVTQMAAELGLDNVTGLHARLPEYRSDRLFSTVTARAYATLDGIVSDCEHLLADGGRILAMKGRSPEDELAALDETWQTTVVALEVPELDEQRHVVVLEKRR
ncbi:MAG: 16S rRNA (guanine(527)-N(7))-methyltransferase RsmG [Pseudomonadota bacterium]